MRPFYQHIELTHLNAGAQKNTVFGPELQKKKKLKFHLINERLNDSNVPFCYVNSDMRKCVRSEC